MGNQEAILLVQQMVCFHSSAKLVQDEPFCVCARREVEDPGKKRDNKLLKQEDSNLSIYITQKLLI